VRSEFPPPEILDIVTIKNHEVADLYEELSLIDVGFMADLVTVCSNPLQHIDSERAIRNCFPFLHRHGSKE